jgi:hypothetical protein
MKLFSNSLNRRSAPDEFRMAGSVDWKQVLKAIKETQRQERGSRELLQLSR